MSDHATTARAFYEAAAARDWDAFTALLSPDVVYRMDQTRELVRGREAYLRFNQEYPGDWHLSIRRVIADDGGAVTICDFVVGDERLTGISFFTFDDAGLVAGVDDVWPEPYEPPADRAHLTERY
jgi:hypothetical protein